MFAKPIAVDVEAQPSALKQHQRGLLMVPSAASLRSLMDKNHHLHPHRPILRSWRRLRSTKEGGRVVRKLQQHSTTTTLETTKMPPNPLVRFLQQECPQDVLPTILSFCGPQKAAALYRTNRHWKNILDQEATWKVLCKQLYKWKEGDAEPESWKELYRMSPCVPIDYPTVEAAMSLANAPVASSRRPQPPRQVRSIRILLRPGMYRLENGLHIQAPPGVSVTVESITLPEQVRWYRSTAPLPPVAAVEEAPPAAASALKKAPARSLFQMLRCASRGDFTAGSASEEPTENCSVSDNEEGSNINNWQSCHLYANNEEDYTAYPFVAVVPPKRATMVMKSRKNNEPMVRVRQGQMNLKNVDLEHSCHGLDIWNGNAAVQVQPPPLAPQDDHDNDQDPTPLAPELRPRAALLNCRVRSKSGRGVVNIDGGHVDVTSCFIAGCAATGLYVGGPGSSATVHQTDVCHNGRGNPRRRGIARGHSGVYLEQGKATLNDCLVAANTLTGISAVSYEKAFLTLTNSTVAQNGTHQMELPPLGTNARSQSFIDNNDLEANTQLPSRSGLWKSV